MSNEIQDVAEVGMVSSDTLKVAAINKFSELTALREKRKLSLNELSNVLKIPEAKLAAIESAKFEFVEPPALLRPLVMSICRYLHVESKPFLDCLPDSYLPHSKYDEKIEVKTRAPLADLNIAKRPSLGARIRTLRGVILLVLIIAIAVVLSWPKIHATYEKKSVEQAVGLRQPESGLANKEAVLKSSEASEIALHDRLPTNHGDVTHPLPIAAPQSNTVATPTMAKPLDASNMIHGEKNTVGQTTSNGQTTGASSNAGDPAASNSVLPLVASTSGMPTLSFSAIENVWISVRGNDGKTFFRGILDANQNKSIAALATDFPLRITVGRADAVVVKVHGSPYSLKSENGSQVVNFSILK